MEVINGIPHEGQVPEVSHLALLIKIPISKVL